VFGPRVAASATGEETTMTTLDLSSIDLRHDQLRMTHELLAAGLDEHEITRLVRSGVLHRVRHGAYTFTSHWADLDLVGRRRLLAHATLRCARSPAVLAGPTAADVFGVPVWDMGDHVHLARLDRLANRRKTRKVQHRSSLLAEDVTVRDGIPLTSGTRTGLDMIALTDIPHALVVVSGLMRAGETTRELLERRWLGMRQNPHTAETATVLELADGRFESPGEALTVYICWDQNLPRPIPQYEIRDRTGRVIARVDFAWPWLGVFLEFDGKVKYEGLRRPGESVSDMVLREKRREELICGITGWRCIRIVWADLFRPERTAARIRATLAGERWAA
jgi:hypothetical protein